jgi:hypothetical protein
MKSKVTKRKSNKDPYSQDSRLSQLSRGTGPSLVAQEQAVTTILVPGTPHIITTTVTSGLTQFVLKLDPPADIEGWATRFAADYEEVRSLGANVRIISTQQSNGVSAVWIDEKFANAPTLTETIGKNVDWLKNSANVKQRERYVWIPNDLSDMDFVSGAATSIGSAAYFKLYTDNAHYNAPIVATSIFLVQVDYLLEFRGIQE